MKKLTLFTLTILITSGIVAQDISVDDIIDNYLENTGGIDNWKALKGIKMTAKINQGGMEIPIEIVTMADGRTYTKYSLQGTEIYQNVFDGETLWSVNFQSMKAEKSDTETTDNFKLNLNDFPDSLLDYKQNL